MWRFLFVCAAVSLSMGAALAAETADFVNNEGKTIGTFTLNGTERGIVGRLELDPGAVTPGWHAIHFHAVGDCSDTAKFEHAKAHVNFHKREHGLLNPSGPDNGDLPNIYAAADGSVHADISSQLVSLAGEQTLLDADGSALIIHANPDDYKSQPIGGAGDRIACAVIGGK